MAICAGMERYCSSVADCMDRPFAVPGRPADHTHLAPRTKHPPLSGLQRYVCSVADRLERPFADNEERRRVSQAVGRGVLTGLAGMGEAGEVLTALRVSRSGLVHRDLKPANLLMDRDGKVGSWGAC